MTRKKVSLTLSCSEETKELLERLAIMFDCMFGSKPNISLFVERIANGTIAIGKQPKDAAARNVVELAKKRLQKAIVELEKLE